jgi:hypothetical protein
MFNSLLKNLSESFDTGSGRTEKDLNYLRNFRSC